MKIGLLIDSLGSGGAERIASELANAWSAYGHEVVLVTLSGTETDHYQLRPEVHRVALGLVAPSHTIGEKIVNNLRRLRSLRHVVKSCRPDVLVSFIDRTNVLAIAALAGCGIPIVVSERIDPREYSPGRAWELARRITYPLADAVVVQTESVVKWAKTVVQSHKVSIIPNFVRDLPSASADRCDTERLILAVGRLAPQKGFDLLIQAFARSEAARYGYRLVILGEGTERPELEALARALGVASEVSLPGVVSEPAEWMMRARIFVLSSRYEGFPNVLLEAMALGCAVVAFDCPSGPGEIIQNEENGLLVPPGNVVELAAAIKRLVVDESERRRLAEAAMGIRGRFSLAAVMSQWDELIRRVAQEG